MAGHNHFLLASAATSKIGGACYLAMVLPESLSSPINTMFSSGLSFVIIPANSFEGTYRRLGGQSIKSIWKRADPETLPLTSKTNWNVLRTVLDGFGSETCDCVHKCAALIPQGTNPECTKLRVDQEAIINEINFSGL